MVDKPVDANSAPLADTDTLLVTPAGQTTPVPVPLAVLRSFMQAAGETLTVSTPGPQTAGVMFNLSGGYRNGLPTALDYSLDGRKTWHAATSPTVGLGVYRFPMTLPAANPAGQVITVRDHAKPTVFASSNPFAVAAPTSSGESASGTVVTDAHGSIIDANKAVWTLVPALAPQTGLGIAKDGKYITPTANVTILLYFAGVINQQNAAKAWYAYKSGAFVNGTDPRGTPPPPASSESKSGTVVTDAHGSIIDANKAAWTLVPAPAPQTGLGIAKDGKYIAPTANVTTLLYFGGVVSQQNSAGAWYAYTGGAFNSASDPRVVTPPHPAAGSIGVHLDRPTGQTVHKEVWGCSTGALIDDAFALAADGGFQASAKACNFSLIRFNALAGGGSGLWDTSIFGSNPGSPNWGWMQNWINHNASFFSPGSRLIIGIGPNTYDKNLDGGYWATAATQFANFMKSAGQECFYWEFGNEPNGQLDMNGYMSAFNQVADALHAVNPAYLVGGPVLAWADGGWYGAFGQQCGSRAGFLVHHVYPTGGNGTDAASTYAAANGGSAVSAARGQVAGTAAANLPIFLGEYSTSWACNDQGMEHIQGALFNALILMDGLNTDNNFTMGGNWEIAHDGSCGAIAPGGSGTDNVTPQAWYLGMAGQTMGGDRVAIDDGIGGNTRFLATVSGRRFAVQLINFDTGADQTIAITTSGGSPSGLTRWEISGAHPNGVSSGIGDLSNIAMPQQSVVIVTGAW